MDPRIRPVRPQEPVVAGEPFPGGVGVLVRCDDDADVIGVDVLERGKVAGNDSADYVLFDTEPDGKYVLGLVLYAGSDEVRPKAPPSGRKVAQYAFVAHDLVMSKRKPCQKASPSVEGTSTASSCTQTYSPSARRNR